MYKLLLCIRYLRTRYIALASVISVMLGVATMIVVNSVMAGFTGEMRDRIKGVLADVVVEARSNDGIINPEAQMALIQAEAGDYIEAMTPIVEVPAMVSIMTPDGERFTHQIQLVGIDPKGKASVGPLKSYLESYNTTNMNGVEKQATRAWDTPLSWELTKQAAEYRRYMKEDELKFLNDPAPPIFHDSNLSPEDIEVPAFEEIASQDSPEDVPGFDPSAPDLTSPIELSNEPIDPGAPMPARIYLGEQIAGYMIRNPETGLSTKYSMVKPGDDVIITTVTATTPPEPRSFSATVVDMFRSGMAEYDSSLVLMNIEQLQDYRGMRAEDGEAITSIQIKLKNYEDASQVVNRLKAAFPPNLVSIITWEEKQGLLLSAVEVETAILNVLLFMIIFVAGFGILAIFFMIVVEKTRDIGILKSLGASSQGVMSIFLSYGLGLGIVGSAAGVGIGLLFVYYINEIESMLSAITGRKVFDENIYYFKDIPTYTSTPMVFWVSIGAIAIAVLASVLPARRASKLHPVRALRFE